MKLEISWAVPLRDMATIVVLLAILGGIILVAVPRRFALAVPAVVLGYLALISAPIHGITERASIDSARGGISVRQDWVDRAVGSDAHVAILYFSVQALPYWQNEFFNASIGPVYTINGPYDGLPQTQVGADPKTQILVDATHSRLVHADYVLTDRGVVPRGQLVGEDPGKGLRLYRTPGRYVHVEEIVSGLYPDAWSGSAVGYQRYGCRGGSVVVTLTSDRLVHPQDQLVTATEGTREVARRTISPAHDRGQRMTVPLRSQGGLCAVRFDISPTAQPAAVLNNGDLRQLGIRFVKFTYRPS